MSAEVNPSVEEENPQAVAEAEQPEVQKESIEQPQDKRRRNDAEYNWAETRRKMQELERQNRELQEQFQKQQKPPEDNELEKLADDDIITKAQAKKMAAKMAREIAQEVIKQREAATVDERLQLKFPDFAEVVSKENIEQLKETEPELALSLMHNPDPFAQGAAAYKLIKKLGLGAPLMNVEKEKAVKNAQKPVSVNAVAKASPLGNAQLFENGLTPELKKQLWNEMRESIKRG